MKSLTLAAILAFAAATLAPPALANPVTPAQPEAVYGAELEGFDYPFLVQRFDFQSQGSQMHMAYLDVAPSAPESSNGRTIVLLHGKNFCAATWEGTIKTLSQAGYRVIAPDQIGFCKSTKPASYQYSFQQLANNTRALLASLGVSRVTLLGHSTGGMLAVRYALMYPEQVEQLAMVNPIGLEDWKAEGVPSITVDQWFAREQGVTAERIRAYERATYYAGQWRAEYETPVQMLAGMYRGSGHQIVAWNSALIYDMIYTQPVVYELEKLKMPTLLLIGQKDTTAIGKDLAPPEVRGRLGRYGELGKNAARRIPQATLVEFDAMGHAPQIQDPDTFHAALLRGLGALKRPAF